MQTPRDNRGDWRFEPSGETDLRRKANPDVQDLLRARMDVLDADEQALLRAMYFDGKSAVELAALTGDRPRAVRRRARRIASRVLSAQFIFVQRQKDLWPVPRRRVAVEVFVHGRSLREAAAGLRMNLYTVRRHHEAVLAMFETFGGANERGQRCA